MVQIHSSRIFLGFKLNKIGPQIHQAFYHRIDRFSPKSPLVRSDSVKKKNSKEHFRDNGSIR